MSDQVRIAAILNRLPANHAMYLHHALKRMEDQLAEAQARITALEAQQGQGWQPIVERLNALADEADREAKDYAETFAPSRRLEGRAEGFRQAANLVREMTNGTSIR